MSISFFEIFTACCNGIAASARAVLNVSIIFSAIDCHYQ